MGNVGKKVLGCLLILGVMGIFSSPVVQAGDSEVSTHGKKHGYMGDPARKRGLELGYDRGYWAAKTDQKFGKEPDVARHDAYHDPNNYYRYEFGRRSVFYQGFRAGFYAGYKQVFGKDAKFKSPRQLGESFGQVDGAPTGAGMAAEANVAPRPKAKTPAQMKRGNISSRVVSDAL
jgi:hypothetical protein